MISSSLVSSNFRNRNYNILLSHYHISCSIGATICATIWFYRSLINFSCHLWLSGSDNFTACQRFCVDIDQCKIDFFNLFNGTPSHSPNFIEICFCLFDTEPVLDF